MQQLTADVPHYSEQLAELLDAISDAVFFKDGLGHWLIINEAAKRLFHLENISWQGKTDQELAVLQPAFQAIYDSCIASDEMAWQAKHMISIEETILQENGLAITFEAQKIPLFSNDGQRHGLVVVSRDITERKSLEKSLQESAEKNSAIFKYASDGMRILDESGHIIDVNEQFCHMLGYTREEMIGMHPAQWNVSTFGDQLQELIAQHFASKVPVRFEASFRRKDGSVFEAENTVVPINLLGRKVLFNASRDISERKALEAAVHRSLEHQKQLIDYNILLGEVNQAIARAEDENIFLQEICTLAIHYSNMRLTWIGLPNAQGEFQILAAAGETGYLDGISISSREDLPEGRGPTGMAWRKDAAIFDAEFTQDPNMAPWRERAAHFGLHTSAVLPIYRGGKLWAAFTTYTGCTRVFNTDVRTILEALAKDIGFGLDHLDGIHQERNTLAFNEALLNNLAAGVSVLRYPDRIIEQVNTRMLEIFEVKSLADMLGHPVREFFPDAEIFQKLYNFSEKTVLSTGHGLLRDIPHKRRDGTYVYLDMSGQKIYSNAGEPARIVWMYVDVTERHHLMEDLSKQVMTDLLTLLPNRRALEAELDRVLARADRSEKLLAVCMLDLDDFKPINDGYGHDAGDRVLQFVGQRLQEILRKTDFVARFGGDEFVLILDGLEHQDQLYAILHKIEEQICLPIALEDGETVSVHLSMGVCLYTFSEGDSPDVLLRKADQALYESKARKAGRDRPWVLFGERINRPERNLAQQLLDAQWMNVWYQPILDSRTHQVVGVEALARLQNADGQILYPEEFLPQLSGEDLYKINKMVTIQALEDLKILDSAGTSLWVSINVAPESLGDDYAKSLQHIIESSGVDPQRITLELLESSDFLERNAALSVLYDIKKLGVLLALDDVGSAYASLLRLKDLPIDKIKLDQEFVRTLEDRPQDLHFIRAIQELAMELQLDLVVEGVETLDILDAMLVTNVPYLQGYALSKPLPLENLKQFLRDFTLDGHPRPNSLLGFYAGVLAAHIATKRMLQVNPSQVEYTALKDTNQYRGHVVLRRLSFGNGSHLVHLYDTYHRALGALIKHDQTFSDRETWDAMESTMGEFLQAILDARL